METRGFLTPEEKDLVAFVHTLETTYSQQSFIEAKRNTRNNDENDRLFFKNMLYCFYKREILILLNISLAKLIVEISFS